MKIDTRRAIRVPLELPIEYRDFDNGTYHSLTKDLSPDGVCIQSKALFDVGTRCRLLFALPHQEEGREITGEVRWQTVARPMGTMGVQFSEPIDFSVPLTATQQALRRCREQTEADFDRLYQSLSDACVWLNSKEIHIEHITEFRAPQDEEHLNHFRQILGVAASGFLIRDIVKEVCDSFTCLVARLDLLRHRLALKREKTQGSNGHELVYYAEEIQKVEMLFEDLTKRFRCVADHIYSPEPVEPTHFDIDECLSIAISVVRMFEEPAGEGVRFDRQAKMPRIESNKQELLMIFFIFLLLSRDSLRTVSDKTITCETKEDKNGIIVNMLHNGYVQQGKYLDILFDNDPLESYFFKGHSTYFMDTLLYYGNLLLKKNNIKIRINNVPGQFNLSLFIPLRADSS